MGRGGTIYVSTDPNNNVPIGTPGVGISIGPMGPTIYNGTDEPPLGSGVRTFGLSGMTFTPTTVVVTTEF